MTTAGITVIPSARPSLRDRRRSPSPVTAGRAGGGHDPRHRRERQHDPRLRGRRAADRQHRRRQHLAEADHVHRTACGPADVTFRGAGGAVALTCSDFSAPPHTGTSNASPSSPARSPACRCSCRARPPRGGTADGKTARRRSRAPARRSRSRCAPWTRTGTWCSGVERPRSRSPRPTRSRACRPRRRS